MTPNYELTIIISNYNQEKHIAETIDSVFAQIVNFPFKVIITDDCSSKDKSKKIIQEYADKYDNIETIFADKNSGYLTNILRAKEKTLTKYFCLLDADDYWTDKRFLQRAYDFLEVHKDYSIYEANVDVLSIDEKKRHPFISYKYKSGTYSKDDFLNNDFVPITQTTGMFFRNCIFINGIPRIMKDAVGTRSEKSFEGDTGRFIMHLKHGFAYYDNRIVGVYRLTNYGIWNSLSESKKLLFSARSQIDFYRYYFGFESSVFVNKAYKAMLRFFEKKQKELNSLPLPKACIDEEELFLLEDVYCFCKQHEYEIVNDNESFIDKVRLVYNLIKA